MAVGRSDLDDLFARYGSEFDWDLVFVDEGQDWPADEIAILRHLYGAERLTVSDGVDQYVRETVADWSRGARGAPARARRLNRCMRMKANLAAFVSGMATNLGIVDWDLEPNAEATGGRVIIVEGDLSAQPLLLQRWCDEAKTLGNSPVDMLACMPPSLVDHLQGERPSRPAVLYENAGGAVWDGASRDLREHFPTHRDQLRFVQYDSCRGLEGWAVVNYRLDELWDYMLPEIINL